MWFVPERAVVRLGNLKCHRAICYVGPSNRAVEPTKYLCHLCDILGQAADLGARNSTQPPIIFHYHALDHEHGVTLFDPWGASGGGGTRNARTAFCAPYTSTSSWPASENRTNCLGSLARA